MPDEPHEERRDGTERRSRPPQTHVTVDGLSNGARSMLQSAIDEAKRTRRWIVTALMMLGATIFAAGQFKQATFDGLEVRPTEPAVRAIVDSVEVLREARDQKIVETLHEQQILLETLVERSESQRRRLDRIEGIRGGTP